MFLCFLFTNQCF